MTPALATDESGLLARHLRRMRVSWAVFIVTAPLVAVGGFLMPHLTTDVGSPLIVTGLVLAMSFWVAVTADREARLRLDRVKRAFAVHAEVSRLLRDHWIVLLMVLLRLELIVLGGLVVAAWGVGPWIGLWFVLAGVLLMARAWPTENKSQALIERARELLP
ncbi:MAG: hypothetical protein C3F15_09130 [Holophagae bacterium]|nr:MAG: hypothetical protein C3F15_09130 [Holophagae bacterium]